MTEIIPFKRPTKPQDLVLRFLSSLGHKRDAEFYLNLFTSTKPESFAVIVLDEDVLRDELDSVLFEIRYLMRLSLYPVVLIHSSNDFLERLEIESYFKRAKIALNFLSDDYSDSEKLEFIRQRIQKESLPLLHLDPDLDYIEEIVKLTNLLKTGKIIFLRKQGGIIDQQDHKPISIVNLRFDREKLFSLGRIESYDHAFLQKCETIVSRCDHKVFISIVSPNNMLRELFTVKGAGTLIQMGSKIRKLAGWEGIDPGSLKRLLEMSFDKKVKEEFFTSSIDQIYLEENYMGAALLRAHGDMCYLSKFAVGTEARGLGIGRDLWNEMLNNHKKIFWRSDPSNFITQWYIKQCDGMHREKDWTIFWKGIDRDQINDAVDYALKQPADFTRK